MNADLPITHCIDEPRDGALVNPLAIHIEGWIRIPETETAILGVNVRIAGRIVAETRILNWRTDVNRALNLPAHTRCGFSMLGYWSESPAPPERELVFHLRLADGSESLLARRQVRFIATDYRQKPYGALLQATRFRRRDEIYGSGPSQDKPSPPTIALVRSFLGPPPVRVLDVGCGLGSYGRPLLADGYDWMGAEVDEADCRELARCGLPHARIAEGGLPFPDESFDAAMCIEVLEHIAHPEPFLAEIRRVAKRLLVSVPNIELLPYLAPFMVVPWHMLEGDHKNFFTRWGLRELLASHYPRVEVIDYAPAPLQTIEGTRLHYHLFAIADA